MNNIVTSYYRHSKNWQDMAGIFRQCMHKHAHTDTCTHRHIETPYNTPHIENYLFCFSFFAQKD